MSNLVLEDDYGHKVEYLNFIKKCSDQDAETIALYLEIPKHVCNTWPHGRYASELWVELENRRQTHLLISVILLIGKGDVYLTRIEAKKQNSNDLVSRLDNDYEFVMIENKEYEIHHDDFCKRCSDRNAEDIARYCGIPSYEINSWKKGRCATELWLELEKRKKLSQLLECITSLDSPLYMDINWLVTKKK